MSEKTKPNKESAEPLSGVTIPGRMTSGKTEDPVEARIRTHAATDPDEAFHDFADLQITKHEFKRTWYRVRSQQVGSGTGTPKRKSLLENYIPADAKKESNGKTA